MIIARLGADRHRRRETEHMFGPIADLVALAGLVGNRYPEELRGALRDDEGFGSTVTGDAWKRASRPCVHQRPAALGGIGFAGDRGKRQGQAARVGNHGRSAEMRLARQFPEWIGPGDELGAVRHAVTVRVLGEPSGVWRLLGHLRVEHAELLFPHLPVDLHVHLGGKSMVVRAARTRTGIENRLGNPN